MIKRTSKSIYGVVRVLVLLCFTAGIAEAKVDLVTLPNRESVQLTIYNSADLTLAREKRGLTLLEGMNELQFSWANTLIDPTSLEMLPQKNAGSIDIFDLTFPPRVRNLGLWNIKSGISGKVPVEISYLTSGLSWRAFYLGTLSTDEKEMRLKGYVRVMNNSGEDYENAQVRLIVGKVHLIDQIAQLAQQQYPFGRPGYAVYGAVGGAQRASGNKLMRSMNMTMDAAVAMEQAPKQVVKEGLSEYFLYTIEGTETIPNGWSKRLPSFDTAGVPVVNLYKYEEERYGRGVTRFLSFKNDEEHKLGETPIPGGMIKVFRSVNKEKNLSYEGQSNFKYIPVEEDVELNLGAVQTVVVEPTLMEYHTENYRFDRWENISGWDEVRDFKIEIKNTREIPVKVEIQRNFNTTYWKIKNSGAFGKYEKVDVDTVKYTLELGPKSQKTLNYVLTTFHGTRAEI